MQCLCSEKSMDKCGKGYQEDIMKHVILAAQHLLPTKSVACPHATLH